MPVSASSHLYRLSNYWGFTAYAISLGSSYFQVWGGGVGSRLVGSHFQVSSDAPIAGHFAACCFIAIDYNSPQSPPVSSLAATLPTCTVQRLLHRLPGLLRALQDSPQGLLAPYLPFVSQSSCTASGPACVRRDTPSRSLSQVRDGEEGIRSLPPLAVSLLDQTDPPGRISRPRLTDAALPE